MLLEFRDITKSFFGVEVLHGVSLQLEAGRVLGLVGENGSGKSTSMNILGGVHRPDGGMITVDGEPYAPDSPRDAHVRGIAFIHQELNLFSNLSIEENIFVSGFPQPHRLLPVIDRKSIRRRTQELLSLVDLSVPPTTMVGALSQGERQLVEIAKALSTKARLIIFDEPTTSLTRTEIDRLFSIVLRLKSQGIGIIYISHILSDVLTLSDDVAVLRDGSLIAQAPRGEFDIDRLISLMVGRHISQLFPDRSGAAGDTPVLEVGELTQPGIVRNLNFDVYAGEVVGLGGLMGAGRSETARILFGLDPYLSGSIRIDGTALDHAGPHTAMQAGIAFLTEDRRTDGLLMNAPVFDTEVLPNLETHASGPLLWLDSGRRAAEARESSRRVQLNTRDILQVLARNLSGGNQQKVVLAKWLMRRPRLFILDEPTRGVDVGAKAEIYRIINELVLGGSSVLMISSEMEELMGMCDRILVMSAGEITAEFAREAFDQEAILAAAMGRRAEAVA